MKIITVYEWGYYATTISPTALETNTHVGTEFIGETLTYTGGASVQLLIDDDDDNFEDGYVETGTAQTLMSDVTIDGVTYLAGSVVTNEFSMIDAAGNEVFVVNIGGVNVGLAYTVGDEPTSGDTFTAVDGRDGDVVDSTDGIASLEPWTNIICFAAGSLIDTIHGPVRVEHLRPNVQVRTLDAGFQPIRWVGSRRVAAQGRFAPIHFQRGAMGVTRDLRLSPKHRVLTEGWQVEMLIGSPSALIEAEHLVNGSTIRQVFGGSVTYVHLLFDDHHVIRSNGLLTESFHPGRVGLTGMPLAQRDEIFALFPELAGDPDAFGPSAHPTLRAYEARLVAAALHPTRLVA